MNTQTFPTYEEVRKCLDHAIVAFNYDARYEEDFEPISRATPTIWEYLSYQLFIWFTDYDQRLTKSAETDVWCNEMAKKFVVEG